MTQRLPPAPTSQNAPPAWVLRRSAGRNEATERVTVRGLDFETTGWTLNASQGGIRAIVEERLSSDLEYEVMIGETTPPRKVVVAWSQDEADGQIVGLKFLDGEGSVPPRDDSSASGSSLPHLGK